jgi:uncharacterized protein (TIGR02421 family)
MATSENNIWLEHQGEGPIFATAIHAGHTLRGELLPLMALDDATRLREEDPYTDDWVKIVPGWIVTTHSRFEVDLNRDRDEAVYRSPDMAWGLHLWKAPLSGKLVDHSLQEYDAFYDELEALLTRLANHYERFVIFDIHAYNHRRQGPEAPPADPLLNPDVNVGTGTLNRNLWGHVVDRFIRDLRGFEFPGGHLDVRENIKFKGRHLARWIHQKFPDSACVLSIEFKKFFMDEWTGEADEEQLLAIREALRSTIPGILDELDTSSGKPKSYIIDDDLVKDIGAALTRNELVRRELPDGSRLHIDRQLPFLCVYRRPEQRDDIGTERLLLGEASYLLTTSREQHYAELVRLVKQIAHHQGEFYGAFLLFELWSAEPGKDQATPLFRIHAPRESKLQPVLEGLESDLLAIDIDGHTTQVELTYSDSIHPPGFKPLMAIGKINYITLGLEVNPIYRDPENGKLFPFELRELHHALARALKRTFYAFAYSHTSQRPSHFYELGHRAISRVVSETDARLADISQRFDLLLHVTPVNVPKAWGRFHRSGFEKLPEFLYRPRPVDPALMKRELFSVPIERIEDPTLAQIFQQKQDELDRQITLVADRNTPRFLYGSRQLFGDIEPELLSLAENILQQLPPHLTDDHDSDFVAAEHFAEIARNEIEIYRSQDLKFSAQVEVRDDITGILVSKGKFLIASDARVPRLRVEPTLAHEIGTHVVTYYNGRQQPLCEFYTGMAGYESLQEGLAVLAEYLTGGLSRPRLRLLAGRVIAVQSICQGADFIETFRVLHDQYGFSQATAFNIAMRVYRGGGYTKDAVYLRGLKNLLSYLARGGDFEMLLVGKISHQQLTLVEELGWRKVLKPAVLRPRYLDRPETQHRLAFLRKGVSVLELISGEACN